MLNTITCKLEECTKPLPKGARKFCCEGHSNKHYQNMRKLEKLAEKKHMHIVRFCKYEGCDKEIPKEAHAQKLYCIGTKCAQKQNAIDARIRRGREREMKTKDTNTCAADDCNNTYPENKRRKYCSDVCRKAQNYQNSEDRIAKECIRYNITKEEALNRTGSKKGIAINPMFLSRGLK